MKKIVNVATTFLWSNNNDHPIKEKLALQNSKENFYTLSDEEVLSLYKDRLVDSEVLYGDSVEVLEIVGEYARVTVPKQAYKNDPSGYPGWIMVKDLVPMPDGWSEALKQVVVSQPTATLNFINETQIAQVVSIGTILPLVEETSTHYKLLTPDGICYISKEKAHIVDNTQINAVEQIIELAKSFRFEIRLGGNECSRI